MTISPSAGDRREYNPRAVAICIPVLNEEALLPAVLEALSRLQGTGRMTLCFLLDGCRDRSGALIEEFAERSKHVVRICSLPDDGISNAGRARRAAMDIGRDALGKAGGALLTTDADTFPTEDWVLATLKALSVSDIVAGRIIREDAGHDPVQDRIERYYDRLYALRRAHDPIPWEARPAHHHIGGASLAFRTQAYDALGGFRPLPSAEDATIVDEAHRLGLRVRRDRDVVVTTSSRRQGRAVNGLADHLRSLARDAGEVRVLHPDQASWQYRGHALARASFHGIRNSAIVTGLAEQLAVASDHVRRVAATSINAEAFATCVVPAAPGAQLLVSLPDAERAIERLEQLQYDRAA